MPIFYSSERTSDDYLIVNNCGTEIFDHSSWIINREQGRIDYQMIYLSKGIGHFVINGQENIIGEGNIIIFRPNESQYYYFEPSIISTSMYVHFTGIGCEQILKKSLIEKGNIFYIGKDIEFEKLFSQMEQNFIHKKTNYEMFCTSYLMLLFSFVGKALSGTDDSQTIFDNRISNCYNYILTHYNEPLDMKKLAQKAFLSESRLTHLFKQVSGYSPIDFLKYVRVERAKSLLGNYNYSISEIASAVGYSDQNYFCRVFKKICGVSPSEYRKQLTQKNNPV